MGRPSSSPKNEFMQKMSQVGSGCLSGWSHAAGLSGWSQATGLSVSQWLVLGSPCDVAERAGLPLMSPVGPMGLPLDHAEAVSSSRDSGPQQQECAHHAPTGVGVLVGVKGRLWQQQSSSQFITFFDGIYLLSILGLLIKPHTFAMNSPML